MSLFNEIKIFFFARRVAEHAKDTSENFSVNFPSLREIISRLVLFFFILHFSAYSQKNLVPNGGFEAHKSKKNNMITNAAPWKGIATVDYYQKPFELDHNTHRGAHGGEAYTGVRFQIKYKEYPYVKLLEPLKKGKVYHFEMFVRLLDISPNALRHLGVVFTKKQFALSNKVDSTNSVYVYERKGLVNDYDWIKIEGDFTAQGGERMATIGNFVKSTRKDMVKKSKKLFLILHEAYYFLDDVSLTEVLTPEEINKLKADEAKADSLAKIEKQEIKTGVAVQLKNIFFETGKAEFMNESNDEIDKLAVLLEKNPQMEIEIQGHTDNVGNEEMNKKLSEDRAKAVFDYLVEKGLSNEINFIGFGSSKPIADNSTDEGRKQNRRVEFVITKQ